MWRLPTFTPVPITLLSLGMTFRTVPTMRSSDHRDAHQVAGTGVIGLLQPLVLLNHPASSSVSGGVSTSVGCTSSAVIAGGCSSSEIGSAGSVASMAAELSAIAGA